MTEETPKDFQLNYKTDDCISSISFSPNSSQFILVSSWDSSVSLFDINANKLKIRHEHNSPVLDACFQSQEQVYYGGIDGILKVHDLNLNRGHIIGQHENTIRVVEYSSDLNYILSGGWDACVKMWDVRAASCISSIQSGKVYALSICGENVIVGTSDRRVCVWDMRNMYVPLVLKMSPLRHQTRCIKAFPNKQGYALSSIGGNVAVEYLVQRPEIQKLNYAFRCHRINDDGIEKIYPVNAISFHQTYNTFVTGGSDGYVNFWDSVNKKRLAQYRQYPTSVNTLSFNDDGSLLAIGCSHLYDENLPDGIPDPESCVFIRHVTDQEARPKTI